MEPNLVVIRLARTIGYGPFSINELILTEAQQELAVASPNFFARSILLFSKWEEKQPHVVNTHLAEICS